MHTTTLELQTFRWTICILESSPLFNDYPYAIRIGQSTEFAHRALDKWIFGHDFELHLTQPGRVRAFNRDIKKQHVYMLLLFASYC